MTEPDDREGRGGSDLPRTPHQEPAATVDALEENVSDEAPDGAVRDRPEEESASSAAGDDRADDDMEDLPGPSDPDRGNTEPSA